MRGFWLVFWVATISLTAANRTTTDAQQNVYRSTTGTNNNHADGVVEPPKVTEYLQERNPTARGVTPLTSSYDTSVKTRPQDLQAVGSSDYTYTYQGKVESRLEKTTLTKPDRDSNPNLITNGPVYRETDALRRSITEVGGIGPGFENHPVAYPAAPGGHFGGSFHGGHEYLHGHDHIQHGHEHLEEGHGDTHSLLKQLHARDVAMGFIGFLIVLSTLQGALITLTRKDSLLSAIHGRKSREVAEPPHMIRLPDIPHTHNHYKVENNSWVLSLDSKLRCLQRQACNSNQQLVKHYGVTGKKLGNYISSLVEDKQNSSDWKRLVDDASLAGLKGVDCAVTLQGLSQRP
uniref:Uncharacterized protein n=1 Tax=Timema poppense TaxID=170557 RepID=A0A7R9DBU8_TIMPO|nr:unnamed protein product [Timema poppensis]